MSNNKKPLQAEPEDNTKHVYTIEEIKIEAFNWKNLPPPDLDIPERCLWLTLSNIYKRFRDGEITKEDGEKLSQNALMLYHSDRAGIDMQRYIVSANADMWKRIEVAGNKYGVERTLSAADAFFESVYGVRPKEQSIAQGSA